MVSVTIYSCLFVVIVGLVGANPDPNTLNNKVLFGYQGWFGTPARGNVGWFHWSNNGQAPSGSNSNFDVWPDLSEFAADELYPTNLHYSNGQTAGLYLASDPRTINRHFQWMQHYGLDGILLQRFVNEIASPDDPHGQMRNDVTRAVINAAASTGRVWAIEYDTSGADPNTILNVLQHDWNDVLKNQIGIVNNGAYLHHEGKQVVAIWGFGFTGNSVSASTAIQVIRWFQSQGVYVIGGVPYNWRTSSQDSQPGFLDVYKAYDLVSPWAVGRYGDQNGFNNLYNQIALPDISFTQSNNLGYAPVIFPGFSWANMHNGQAQFNQIPRAGGSFFNAQANTYANHPGVTFIKIAMFDEVDEGTAMFKAAATKQNTPVDGNYLHLDIDGTPMASDQYLVWAGQLTARLHN